VKVFKILVVHAQRVVVHKKHELRKVIEGVSTNNLTTLLLMFQSVTIKDVAKNDDCSKVDACM
jgi:hypothetical protein